MEARKEKSACSLSLQSVIVIVRMMMAMMMTYNRLLLECPGKDLHTYNGGICLIIIKTGENVHMTGKSNIIPSSPVLCVP